MSSFDKDSLKRLDDKLTETLDTLGIDYIPLRQDTLNQELLQNNAGNVSRGHLIETVDTENDTISSNSQDNYWLLTDDGYLEFHGGGVLKNSHGEIMQSYCSKNPVGSTGIETGLMKIFNYASHEGAGNNGRSVSNYKGPFDRDMIIEKILDAGLNYYFKEPLDINNRKYWQWDLKENLNNNAKRRVKLPDNIFEFYQQFEPGSNWYSYVSNNPLRYTDPTGMEGDNWLEASRELQILEYNETELLDKLGTYGDPSILDGPSFSSSSTPPQYKITDTYKIYGTMMLADAFKEEYGVLTSLASGSGLSGSLKLRTFRRKSGKNDVTAFELFRYSETGEVMYGTGEPRYGFMPIDNKQGAAAILMQNPDLMEDAILSSKPSDWQRFWEGFAEIMDSGKR